MKKYYQCTGISVEF